MSSTTAFPSTYALPYVCTRTQKCTELSTILVNGVKIPKLDYLGAISINGRTYFNVSRRYNSVYEIVFEDYLGEFHFHKDYTVYESIKRLLCLSDEKMRGIHALSVFSMKHNGSPAISDSFLEMRWSAIQAGWQGLIMDLGGILEYAPLVPPSAQPQPINADNSTNIINEMNERLEDQEDMIERCRRIIRRNNDEMNARLDEQDDMIDYCVRTVDHVEHEVKEIRTEIETPASKNTVHYPDAPEKAMRVIPYHREGAKRQRLTDRFEEVVDDESDDWEVEYTPSSDEEDPFPHHEEEEEEEEEEEDEDEEEEDEDEDYLELRSGQKYYK